jgi:phosphatidate cytidylyltransferase
MLQQRIITGSILIAAIFVAAMYLSATGWKILASGILLVAAYELAALMGIKQTYSRLLYCGLIGAMFLYINGNLDMEANLSADLLVFSAGFWIFILIFLIFLHDGVLRNKKFIQCALIVTSNLALLLSFHAVVLAYDTRPILLIHGDLDIDKSSFFLVLLFLVVVSDTSAYFFGKRFGKKKFFPNISPNKTLAGFWASNLCVLLYAFICAFIFSEYYGAGYDKIINTVIVFMILNLLAITGDLFFSALKRQANVKDTGTFLPGHGGVLDRVDSLMPVLCVWLLAWTYIV